VSEEVRLTISGEAVVVVVLVVVVFVAAIAIPIISIVGSFRSRIGRHLIVVALSLLLLLLLLLLLPPPLRVEGGDGVEDAYRSRQVLLGYAESAELRDQS